MSERTMSRIACIGMTLALLSCAFLTVPGGVAALTSGDFDYELVNGGAAVEISGYHGAGGAVTIPGMIDGRPVVSIGQMAFGNM
ncbi:MAG: hypothetical protein LUO79_02530, partial [Methanomassiliicoccales archaeon]|nr:hypothetical protein [Methanomassiliicoccales archaeon]